MTGLTFAVYGLPFILFSSRAGKLIDKRSPVAVALWLVIPVIMMTMSYGFFSSPWSILGLGLVEGIVQSAIAPAGMAAIAKAAPLGRSSAAQGLSGSVNVFGQMLAAFIAPSIYGNFGARTTFVSVGIGIGAVAAIAALLHAKNLRGTAR
jgi:MFS family permease